MQLQQGFAIDETGFRVKSHSSNRRAQMSALGQRGTLGHVRMMSALPPKADINHFRSAVAKREPHVQLIGPREDDG